MKTASKYLMTALPLTYCLGIGCMFLIQDVADEVLFAFLGLYLLLACVVCAIHFAVVLKSKPEDAASGNVWFLTSNLLVYAVSITFLIIRIIENRIAEENGAIEGGLGIFLLIVLYLPHWITYGLSRVLCAIGCSRATRERFTPITRILLILLHLFPVTDLISAMILHLKWKRTETLPATSD